MTPRVRFLMLMAFAFSAATSLLGLLSLVGYVMRWLDWAPIAWVPDHAGQVGCFALGSAACCLVVMVIASKVVEVETARRQAEATSDASTTESDETV